MKFAFIRFYNFITEGEVYKIDASLSQEVVFNSSTEITILPNFNFTERNTYYLSFDRGIVHGIEGCGPVNDPVVNKTLWSFEVMDATPPVITFVENPIISNGTIRLHWNANENVTWACKLVTGHSSESIVSCSQGRWTGYNLTEGSYELTINGTDDVGNVAIYIHNFQVDLTAPEVTILQRPQEISNHKSFTIRFTCNELCSIQCQFYTVSPNQMDNYTISCNNGVFSTPTLDHNATNTIIITATDQVGNKGEPVSYSWETDFESPIIYGISNVSAPCNNSNPSYTGEAQAVDDKSRFPSITYSDANFGCILIRTWLATDDAGNNGSLAQYINIDFSPVIILLPQVSFPCDNSTNSTALPNNTVTVPNPCSLPQQLIYTDSVSQYVCPSEFTRNWIIDICNRTATYTQNIVLYNLCSPYACGRNEEISRGICSFGECQCNLPWYGENCSSLMYAPVAEPVNNSILQEAQYYSINLTLTQGTAPLSWSLISSLRQLSIDQFTGQVTWTRAQAGNHTISVQVENQVGEIIITWTLQVYLGYSTQLNPIFPTIYSSAQPIILNETVHYVANNFVENATVPVSIDITNNGSTRTLNTTTSMNGSYSVTFYPAVTEYGFYQAASRHPSMSNTTVQAEWTYSTIVSDPGIIELIVEAASEFDETFYNASVIHNEGPTSIYDIKVIPLIPNTDLIKVELSLRGLSDNDTIEPGGEVVLDIRLTMSQPLSGLFVIALNSTQNTLLQIFVRFEIEPSLPQFLIKPPLLNTRVVRGQSRIFEFNITNVGQAVIKNVQFLFPNTDIISPVSFGNLQQANSTLNLSSRQSAVLSVFVKIAESQELGDVVTSIFIISMQTSATIPVTLTVSSNLLMNLTIVVEDEFTYFASGEPLVDNAVITLINYQRNVKSNTDDQ